MKSADPATYTVARGIVFAAINEKLRLPVDQHPDVHVLGQELLNVENAFNETPNMPMREFLDMYKARR
jgi:hypothetical protein